ncbi:UNVERIFIED_CONTAM: hypothetical protein K2H54_051592 [Gekko kuhli]
MKAGVLDLSGSVEVGSWYPHHLQQEGQLHLAYKGGQRVKDLDTHDTSTGDGQQQVPSKHYPYAKLLLPLGEHLLPAIKKRLFLFWDPEMMAESKDMVKERDSIKKHLAERTWDNWLSGYNIYMVVVIPVQFEKALALIKYLDIIYRIYAKDAGPAWLR